MNRHLNKTLTTKNAVDQAIQTIIDRAEQLLADNEADQALTGLREAELNYPDNAQLPYLIGKHTAEKKSIIDGIKKLEETLARFPDHLGCLLELGSLHLKPGNLARATPYYHKALEISPQNPNCYLGMGSLNQRKGDLPLAVENYRKAIELQLKQPIVDTELEKKDDFKIKDAEKLLWDTLALFEENGLHVFMAFGSLLGIERNGELLLHDKDVDVGLPFSEMNRAIRFLQHHGWQEVNNSFGYISPRAVVHKETGFSLDLFGFLIDEQSKKALCLGAVMPATPKEWNIIWEFDRIELEKKLTPDGTNKVWALKDPTVWLDTIYGDWHTPDKNFDTMASAKNLRSFSLMTKCFVYSRIFEQWTKNHIPRALSLTRAALAHEPNDALIKRVLSRLEDRRK